MARKVYVYGIDNSGDCQNLLRFLTGDTDARIEHLQHGEHSLTVCEDDPAMCGPLSGMAAKIKSESGDFVFDLVRRDQGTDRLISTNGKDVFVRIRKEATTFFLGSSSHTIDLDSRITGKAFFDIRDCFLSAVPAVMYMNWAFSGIGWRSREIGACLIVDDPLLRPRYGYVDFQNLTEMMTHLGFSTNIAFIPWNYRRTHAGTASLVRKFADRLSISIHGCDHTGGEFGTESIQVLNARTKLARSRMQSHFELTGIREDPIMIFPQGVFSRECCQVLKGNNYMAAVNTDITPVSDRVSGVEIREVWDLAIMKHASFPVFTRRYPAHDLVNFAFDILLGKPCLIVGHHDFFKHRGRQVVDFLTKLKSLNVDFHWRTLGEVIRRCYRERRGAGGEIIARMYANELTIDNPDSAERLIHFEKREDDPKGIRNIIINLKVVDWQASDGWIRFQTEIPAGGKADVRVIYIDSFGAGKLAKGTRYHMKTAIRRYLSELRDNYLSKVTSLNKLAAVLRRTFR